MSYVALQAIEMFIKWYVRCMKITKKTKLAGRIMFKDIVFLPKDIVVILFNLLVILPLAFR